MNSTNFKETLFALVEACEADETAIQKIKSATKDRLADALVKHGIDPGAVRHLISWRKAHAKDPLAIERVEELHQHYRAILTGDTPTVPSRADSELEKVLRLTNSAKPPKVDLIMRTIGCSRGKAHKLRTLAAARLAAKISSSSESDERELEHHRLAECPTFGELAAKRDAARLEVIDCIANRPELAKRLSVDRSNLQQLDDEALAQVAYRASDHAPEIAETLREWASAHTGEAVE